MNENNEGNSGSNRGFDWGPPSNSVFDKAKEWLVYLILLILLAAGAWFLLDVDSKKVQDTRQILAQKPLQSVEVKTPASASVTEEAKSPGKFMVQLGAFADRKSAQDSFDALKAQGFEPILGEPDTQFEIYRVSVGPFQLESEAEQVAEKLNSLEFHCFVIESL